MTPKNSISQFLNQEGACGYRDGDPFPTYVCETLIEEFEELRNYIYLLIIIYLPTSGSVLAFLSFLRFLKPAGTPAGSPHRIRPDGCGRWQGRCPVPVFAPGRS
ncbi:hypothetical protein WCLP8_3500007 [uncultured Gammaproteobacteria bacterium]